MKRVIIMGSPRSNGRSAHLAEMLFEANIDERPEDELFLVPVSEVEIGPCIGCNACRRPTPVTFKDDDGDEVTELRHRCVFDDDMQTLYDLLDDADDLTVVCPVYFSGAPALMKCVLDRLQPYFWVTQVRGRQLMREGRFGSSGQSALSGRSAFEQRLLAKRPATLHIVGEGGDPHGFAPLVSEMKSSLACAGFRLERVLDWVGKIDQSGEIVAEATEVVLPKSGAVAVFPDASAGEGGAPSRSASSFTAASKEPFSDGDVANRADRSAGSRADSSADNRAGKSAGGRAKSGAGNSGASVNKKGRPTGAAGSRNRPKLDLSSGQKSRRQASQKQSASKKPGKKASNAKRGKSRG